MPTSGRQLVKASDIDYLVDELRNRATLLAKIARRMDRKGVKSISVMNYVTAKNSLDAFKKLYNKCDIEVPED